MPYMMDELDELFRDAVPATQVQPPGLRERVDELKRVGCCEYVPALVLPCQHTDRVQQADMGTFRGAGLRRRG